MLGNVTQHPSESKKYVLDYSKFLDTEGGELLSSVTVTIDPLDTTTPLRVLSTLSNDQTQVLLTIYDGQADEQYTVGVLVTTTYNQRDHDCLGVTVTEQC